MDLQSAAQFVSNVGVPAAIAFFFIFKLNSKLGDLVGLQKELQENTTSNQQLARELSELRQAFITMVQDRRNPPARRPRSRTW